jgi:hypothetical protein
MAHDLGYKWRSGKSFKDIDYWDEYKSRTCYNITKAGFSYFDFYNELDFIFIESTEIEDEKVEFKVGNKVRIKKTFKPEEHRISNGVMFVKKMDQYIGQVLTIKAVVSLINGVVIYVEECPFNFDADWLELVEDVAEQKTQADFVVAPGNINKSAKQIQVGGDHYKNFAIQPIEYILKNNLSFGQGNVIKYVTRYKYKNGLEDLKKAKHYIDLLIEEEYGGVQENR